MAVLGWILIGAAGLVLGDKLLNGDKKTTGALTPAPRPSWSPQQQQEERSKQMLADWEALFAGHFSQARWITTSAAKRFIAQNPRPLTSFEAMRALAGVGNANAAGLPDGVFHKVQAHNQAVLERQKVELKAFFETVEKSPLTDEQIHACICMDDNVMVVAAAGSGKTSTMVAKAGYVLNQGLATPEQVLLLAFNRDAADELGQRVRERLSGIEGIEGVTVQTFHGFGLSLIAEATGRKPTLAPWLEHSGQDLAFMAEIAQAIASHDPEFRRDWDLFRTVYARDLGALGEAADPEASDGRQRGFRTADGKLVKSKEEQLICNWLFFNGVNYAYEPAYEHDTADRRYRQYRPDFFYPDINLYHEHFALDDEGRAPAHFGDGYVKGVHWKRALHAEKGTELFETTSAQIRSNEALDRLREELVSRGVELSFDPARKTDGPPPLTDEQLARTLRVFQQHVKSNGLSQFALEQSAQEQSARFGYRAQLFLRIYERLSAEWERRLRAGGYIDFEDMLRQAAELVEAGRYENPYTVVLADEFQDSSRARARLLQVLTRSDDAHLTVVGDDWQGVNRFAGADLRVMSEFQGFFSPSSTLQLTTTFRCPQALCDVSSAFVQANPRQLKKTVQSTSTFDNRPLQAYGFSNPSAIEDHIEQQLRQMVDLVVSERLQPGRDGRINVLILGRYKTDKPGRLSRWTRLFRPHLDVRYKTIHASKGLEAEYVYVLGLVEGRKGFPSQIEDDPILGLAMPDADPFAMAEERRLFYVALTRASRQARLYTSLDKPSRFVTELVANEQLIIEPVDGETVETCPKCQAGVLRVRQSEFGAFHGCSRYAVGCDFKRTIGEGETISPR